MKYIIEFLIYFIIVFILYYFIFVRKSRRGYRVPSEAKYLINLYNLDIKKFSYKKFLINVDIVSSIDVSLVTLIVLNLNGLVWQLLFSIIVVVPVAIISFMIIGRYYQNNNNILAAIGRYNYVVKRMSDTAYAEEACYRIIECCHSAGLMKEAQNAYDLIKLRFPNGKWCKKASALMNKGFVIKKMKNKK